MSLAHDRHVDTDDLFTYHRQFTYPPIGERCKCGNLAELWDEMDEDDYCADCWEERYIKELGRRFIA